MKNAHLLITAKLHNKHITANLLVFTEEASKRENIKIMIAKAITVYLKYGVILSVNKIKANNNIDGNIIIG